MKRLSDPSALRRPDLWIFTLALALGGWLLFSNLHGAIYLSEDEARPFALMSSGQLMYLMGHPVFSVFKTQASVFYLAALLNWFSIFLLYFLCRLSMGRWQAAVAALVYAVFPLRIDYARTMFPAAFMEPYILSAALFFFLALSRRQARWMIFAGVSLTCVFLTHYMGYAIILGMASSAALYWFLDRKRFGARATVFFVFNFLAGALGALTLVTQILSRVYRYDYFATLKGFYGDIPLYESEHQALDYLSAAASRLLGSADSFLTTAVILSAVVLAVSHCVRRRDKNAGFFLASGLAGAGVLWAASLAGKHLIFDRHFVWLASLYAASFGIVVPALYESAGRAGRRILLVLFSAWIGMCLLQSCLVVRETFQITPINSWLRQNHIEKRKLLTLWKIREPSDTVSASMIPTVSEKPIKKGDRAWYRHTRTKIAWPLVYRAYQRGLCAYILTSGLDDLHSSLGDGDPMLAHVEPLMAWPHPYTAYRHRSFYLPDRSLSIRLYRLEDVFSRKNFLLIAGSPAENHR